MSKSAIILEALAADHAKANPEATERQLMQLFAISLECARRAIKSVRSVSPPPDAATIEAALEYAKKRRAGKGAIVARFPAIGMTLASRLAKAACVHNERESVRLAEQMKAAQQYVIKNCGCEIKQVAKDFGVSYDALLKWRRNKKDIRGQSAKLEPPKPVPRKRNRLYAIVDGQSVPLGSMRRFDLIERFVGVKTCQNA
jgi:transposase-like protein